MHENALRTHGNLGRTALTTLWIVASALGALLGGSLALTCFPSAGFAKNPTGHFDWNLIGFSGSIGALLAIAQALVLLYVVRPISPAKILCIALWVPVTAVGTVFSILPLWWLDFLTILMNFPAVSVPMLPGFIVMAAGQKMLLHWLLPASRAWIARSVIGAAIGTTLGLVASWFLGGTLEPWAFLTGAGLGAFQGPALLGGSKPSK